MNSDCVPLFKGAVSLYFFRVGLCSHTILTFSRRRGRSASVGCTRVDGDSSMRWTRSPPDPHLKHVLKSRISEEDLPIIIAIFLHQTTDAPRNHGLRDRAIVTILSPEAQSDGVEGSWKNSTIAVRSNRDRGVIKPRSRRDRAAIVALTSWN